MRRLMVSFLPFDNLRYVSESAIYQERERGYIPVVFGKVGGLGFALKKDRSSSCLLIRLRGGVLKFSVIETLGET